MCAMNASAISALRARRMLEHIAMSGLWILLALTTWLTIFAIIIASLTVVLKPRTQKNRK